MVKLPKPMDATPPQGHKPPPVPAMVSGQLLLDPRKRDLVELATEVWIASGGPQRYIAELRKETPEGTRAFMDYSERMTVGRLPKDVNVAVDPGDKLVEMLREAHEWKKANATKKE